MTSAAACLRCGSGWRRRRSGIDAGQLLNMLFGNTSLHDDVVLKDVAVPRRCPGIRRAPAWNRGDLRRRLGLPGRAIDRFGT